MIVERLMYTMVTQGITVPMVELREHDADVDAFLADTVTALADRAALSDASASFSDPIRSQLFDDMQEATTDAVFLASARQLAQMLVDEMDGRTLDGLLVCLTAIQGNDKLVAVLKLQVVSAHGARLESVAGGTEKLTAVRDVLDNPSELQKGALFGYGAADHVIVNDKLKDNSQYFLRAMGIRLKEKESRTARRLLGEVQAAAGPAVAAAAAARLHEIHDGDLDVVLDGLQRLGVGVTSDHAQVVAAHLRDAPRPVDRVRTSAPVSTVYYVRGIKVTVPAGRGDSVRIRTTGTGWELVIDSDVPIVPSIGG